MEGVPVIKLFQFPPMWNMPNVSPFCMKIETYLRMTQLPYQKIQKRDPRKSPKGKLPFIEDDGIKITDSDFIIRYLKQKYGDYLDAHLTAEQKSQGLALQRMLEEHLYWVMLYFRWVDPHNWPVTKKAFFGDLSILSRRILPFIIQKNIIKALYAQGVGRHHPEEISQLGLDDLKALNTILNHHPFLLGENPTSLDASGYAFIANILDVPIESPLKDYVKSQNAFGNYCAQMKERYY